MTEASPIPARPAGDRPAGERSPGDRPPGERPPGARSIEEILADARARLVRLTPRTAFRVVAAGGMLIDIRPAAQRRALGEVPGSWVIERNHLEWRLDPANEARLPWVTDYDIYPVVMCYEGYTSSLAAAALQDLGLARATDVIGGFAAWAADGLPTAPASARTTSVAVGAVHGLSQRDAEQGEGHRGVLGRYVRDNWRAVLAVRGLQGGAEAAEALPG